MGLYEACGRDREDHEALRCVVIAIASKFSGEKVRKKRRDKTLPRKAASFSSQDPDSLNIEKKISHLINLPALKSIKTRA